MAHLILTVDDSEPQLYARSAILRRAGFEVVMARSGGEALARIAERHPDLVVLDMRLPDIDGLEVCRRIKGDPATSSVLVLHVSAVFADAATRVRALDNGADGYLVEPIQPQELVARVRSLLRLADAEADARRAQAALRESRERLSFALEASQTGAWDLDLEDHTAYRSVEHDRIFGYQELLPRWTYDIFLEHILPDDRARVDAAYQQAIAARDNWKIECRIRRVDGEVRWIWAIGRHYTDGSGRKRVAGIIQDVTDRRRIEEALRAKEERLQEALEASRSFAFEWQPPSDKVRRSEGCSALLGLTGDEAVHDTGEGFFRRVHPDDRERLTSIVRSLRPDADRYETRYRVLRPDGTIVVFNESARAYFDAAGTCTRVLGITTDVTARVQAEEERRKIEDRLTVATEAASLGIHHYDVVAGKVEWDGRIRELFGVDADEPITYETFMAGVHPDDREGVDAEMTKALDPSGDGSYYREYRVINRKDRSERWLSATGQTFFEQGRAVRLIGTVQDISERKRMEDSLRLSEARNAFLLKLSDRLRPLTDPDAIQFEASRTLAEYQDAARGLSGAAEDEASLLEGIAERAWAAAERARGERALREANARLSEADRRKDEFIAVLSHELRNPLAPIRYALPLIRAERLGEHGDRALGVIERQVSHLTRLVDDLLTVSRIASGKFELRAGHVTLQSVVAAAVEGLSPAVFPPSRVKVAIPDDPVWLYVDSARITQAITNLLDNSAKHTTRDGEISVEAGREGERAVIRVRDTGVGISADALPRVFDMFWQVRSANRSQTGLGIGLALVKRLVEMQDGTVEAKSEGLGRGAEFTIRLPVAAAPQEGLATTPAPARTGRRFKVLIVDDNADLVEMLSMTVGSAGHEVRTAFSGRGALAAAIAFRPDVVLLDIGLPDINGLDVARLLRRTPSMAGVRLVALTGWGQEGDRLQSEEAGFDYHLTKPTDPETLLELIAGFEEVRT